MMSWGSQGEGGIFCGVLLEGWLVGWSDSIQEPVIYRSRTGRLGTRMVVVFLLDMRSLVATRVICVVSFHIWCGRPQRSTPAGDVAVSEAA